MLSKQKKKFTSQRKIYSFDFPFQRPKYEKTRHRGTQSNIFFCPRRRRHKSRIMPAGEKFRANYSHPRDGRVNLAVWILIKGGGGGGCGLITTRMSRNYITLLAC